MSHSSAVPRALTVARTGQSGAAAAILDQAAIAGDSDAAFQLAIWTLSGDVIRRDLERSRHWFGVASRLGRQDAARIYIALLANGTGGPRDWSAATERLRQLSRTEPRAAREVALLDRMQLDSEGNPVARPGGKLLSDGPRVVSFPEFCTADECEYLIDSAGPLFAPAQVVNPATGKLDRHPVRSSDGAVFPLIDEGPVIHALNRRIAAASNTAATQGEPLQVLRYWSGQEYRAHMDSLPDARNQRIATMLIYLNDKYCGGETAFLRSGLEVRGRTGEAVLFRNALDDGRPDPDSLHAGLPVTNGVKLIASRWIRAEPINLQGSGA